MSLTTQFHRGSGSGNRTAATENEKKNITNRVNATLHTNTEKNSTVKYYGNQVQSERHERWNRENEEEEEEENYMKITMKTPSRK